MRIIACALSLLVASSAGAYSVSLQNNYVVRWPTPTFSYQLDADGAGSITDGSDVAQVRASQQAWNTIDCTGLNMIESGTTTLIDTSLTSNRSDGINRIVWVEDNRWQFGDYVLGVTQPVFDGYGRIAEADIALNGYRNTWSTNGARNTIDVRSVMIHEMGHMFGLNHVLEGNSMSDPPTMSPAVDPWLRSRDLTRDDELGSCFLYPSTASFACSQEIPCPKIIDQNDRGEFYSGQLTCTNAHVCGGVEQLPQGTKQLGETCTSERDCANEMFCQGTNAGGFCSKTCDPNITTSCPTGFRCLAFSNAPGGACLSDSLFGGGGAPGGGVTPPAPPLPPAPPTPPVATCACDVSFSCDVNCACDRECTTPPVVPQSNSCACDTSHTCEASCSCDTDCAPRNSGGGGGGCNSTGAAPIAWAWAVCASVCLSRFRRK